MAGALVVGVDDTALLPNLRAAAYEADVVLGARRVVADAGVLLDALVSGVEGAVDVFPTAFLDCELEFASVDGFVDAATDIVIPEDLAGATDCDELVVVDAGAVAVVAVLADAPGGIFDLGTARLTSTYITQSLLFILYIHY